MSRKRNPQTLSGKRSQSIKKFLTKKGRKLVLPTKTNKESEVIQKHLESLQQLLEICVPHISNLKRRSIMECEIENNDSFDIIVTKPRGKSLYTMGTPRNKKMYLQPEQALWLAQQKKLIIFYQQKILETQQMFHLMLKYKKVSIQEFLCFSNLTRAGYVVWRLCDLPSPKIELDQKKDKGSRIQKRNKKQEKTIEVKKQQEVEKEIKKEIDIKKEKEKEKKKEKEKELKKEIEKENEMNFFGTLYQKISNFFASNKTVIQKEDSNIIKKTKIKKEKEKKQQKQQIQKQKQKQKQKRARKEKIFQKEKEKDTTNELEISYVVFKKKKNFRKREPGKPVMYLVCLSNKQPPPDQNQLQKLKNKYCEAPIVFGIVDHGSVLFCEFQDLELEDLSINY
ncbi:tRNA-splicing endonuclease subunit sen54 [Anaeramoeba flamelloides]|uniref:tRNA-splicing endonuclease subunit sen54 n=1 Tax=Anaeramoeba flamelloides TaxID=1746091 RepID=A0ABQ8XXM6_9EUKA|nr:tRNA-splicing endonuclease subunit sen54 [Anaeramoeba flamelloides]